MIFVKKQKENINMMFVDKIVRSYFKCLKENKWSLTYSEIAELLRFSMCRLLDLQSKGYSEKIENLSYAVIDSLTPVVDDFNIDDMTFEYKTGLLEACIHAMEMSRKKVEV